MPYQIAFVVDMLNEGVDIPDIECILMLRPTESQTILKQQLGRGLRLSPSTEKRDLLVLDFIGNNRSSPQILESLGINVTELKKDKLISTAKLFSMKYYRSIVVD